MIRSQKAFFLILCVCLGGCAQQKPPTGGPVDKEPPKVVKAFPPNGSTRFQSNSFMLQFDEFVKLNKLKQQLLISPPMKEDPEVSIRKRSIIVELKDSLYPNTTYSFNFGSGVADITENNTTRNLRYVVSTGKHIDSMIVDGKVRDAELLEPEKDMMVMLYRSTEDSVPIKKRPYYFTKTDEEGNFTIRNVQKGKYKVFALRDKNYNYRFDLPNEAIAFLDTLVRPVMPDSTLGLDLRAFKEPRTAQHLSKVMVKPAGMVRIVYSIPAEDPGFKVLDREALSYDTIREVGNSRDTVTYWFKGVSGPDTLRIAPYDGDSTLDTVKVTLAPLDEEKEQKFSIASNVQDPHSPFEPVKLTLPHPASHSPERITMVRDSDTVAVPISPVGPLKRRFRLQDTLEEKTDYELFLAKGAFTDLLGRSGKPFEKRFKTREKAYYGSVLLTLDLNMARSAPVVLRLLDKKSGETIRKHPLEKDGKKVRFKELPPAEYQLLLILDENGNGKWDPGNYLAHEQPERSVLYDKKIEVRSNWDLELTWKVSP